MATLAPTNNSALVAIAAVVGDGALTTDAAELRYYSQDVFSNGPSPLAVFRPADTAMLARGIAAATAAGVAIVPRGGGMSYTSGYLPAEAGALLIDTGAMMRPMRSGRVGAT